jgi:hypothetical protein
MATLIPEYFETTIAAAMTAPAAGTSQVITVSNGNAVPTVTGSDIVWAWVGNANVEASLEAVKITAHAAGSTSVTVTRGANNGSTGSVVTHSSGDGFYGPALVSDLIDELLAGTTGLTAHLADTTDAHAGSAITNTPAGTIAATTVQAALNELDTEKAPLASPTFTGVATSPAYAASGLTGATQASRYVGATASGAPASGTFSIGDFIIDRAGSLWVCTTGGTPGTWAEIGGGGSLPDHDHSVATTQGGTSLNPDDLFLDVGPLTLGLDRSPAQLTGDVNDYNPTDLNATVGLRLDSDASRTITGIVNTWDGQMLVLVNVGSNDIVLAHESASSTADNRFSLPGAANLTLTAGHACILRNDATSSRWRVVASTLTGAGGGMTSFDLDGDTGTAETVSNGETVIVAGGTGLSSAVAATNTVTVNLDIDSLTADASPDGAADYVATYDASAGTHKKVLLDNLPGGGSVATDTIFDAAGDLVQGTGSNTSARLAIGTANQLLRVNAGATAAEWATISGSGDSTHTAAYGSRPAASNAGDLFLPSDGFSLERDTGAAWVPWGPLFPLTLPSDTGFAWVNQGTSTITTTRGALHLKTVAGENSGQHMRVKTAPATPYTVTALLLGCCVGGTNPGYGLVHRQSSDGKIRIFALFNATNERTLAIDNWTNETTFSARPADADEFHGDGPVWFRMADNGTNCIYSISANGQDWIQVYSVGRTTFLTPDQIGFACRPHASYDAHCTVISWVEA